jgi:NADH:ubiquinone oxidoreductase subunit K
MFLGDQGRDALVVKKIVTFENLPLIGAPSSIGQVYLGPFYYYLISPLLPLFNFNPTGLAFGVFAYSTILLWFSMYFISKIFGKYSALIFYAFTVFSTLFIENARFSWNPNLLPFFAFLTIIYFHSWLERPTVKNGLIFGGLLGLSLQLHHLTLFLIPSMAIFYILKFFKNKNKNNNNIPTLKSLVHPSIAFSTVSSPLILFDLKHSFINLNAFLKLILDGSGSTNDQSFFERFLRGVEVMIESIIYTDLNNYFSLFLYLAILILGLYIAKKSKNKLILIVTTTLFFYSIFFALIASNTTKHYFVAVYLFILLIISVGISKIRPVNFKITLGVLSILVYTYFQFDNYFFFKPNTFNQLEYAKKVAESFVDKVENQPIQLVTIPFTETHGQFRYFLDILGIDVLPEDSTQQAEELYVMCFEECNPLGDGQWQIAVFSNKTLDQTWSVENVKIFKIIHGDK